MKETEIDLVRVKKGIEPAWLSEYWENELDWGGEGKTPPYINFPADWHIRIIPPFHGAFVRFLVKKDPTKIDCVSVYLDIKDNLGCVWEPYWEIHPHNGDCARCLMGEVDELLKLINEALEQL